MFQIYTDDFYKDISYDILEKFDTSDWQMFSYTFRLLFIVTSKKKKQKIHASLSLELF